MSQDIAEKPKSGVNVLLGKLTEKGVVMVDLEGKRYETLAKHPRIGDDFRAGLRVRLPLAKGSRIEITDPAKGNAKLLSSDVSHVEVELVSDQIIIAVAEFEGANVNLPGTAKPISAAAAPTNLPAVNTPPKPPGLVGASKSSLASATKPAQLKSPGAATPNRVEFQVDILVEMELRAYVADEAHRQQKQGLTQGWAMVLKTLVDRRIQSIPASSKEPVAALMLKGIVEQGMKDQNVHQLICMWCIRLGQGDPAISEAISDGARAFANSLRNLYAVKTDQPDVVKTTSGLSLFDKALAKLSSKAWGARMSGIEYIVQQIPYEAAKTPRDPRDQADHVKRIESALMKVESNPAFKEMVDKKMQAKYQANLDRARGELKKLARD